VVDLQDSELRTKMRTEKIHLSFQVAGKRGLVLAVVVCEHTPNKVVIFGDLIRWLGGRYFC
jgi:hypothetical protein